MLSIELKSCIFTWSRKSGELLLRETRRELREIDVVRHQKSDVIKLNIERNKRIPLILNGNEKEISC